MPWFPEHDRIHLLLILLWVPLQMLALQYIRGGSEVSVGSSLAHYLPTLPSPTDLFLHLSQLASWARQRTTLLFSSFRKRPPRQSAGIQEEPQEIVELHERDHVFFGASQSVRKKHPPKVRFRVGDTVEHRKLGYLGVVVGWDEVARAPALWMAMRYPDLQQEIRVRDQPNYRVLFDSRTTLYEINPIYVAQEDLKDASFTEKTGRRKPRASDDDTLPIKHSLLPEYFDYFDSNKFIPRPWLRRIYPRG
uniref:Hemimethylated DNA-binding protein YccV like n=1 Tax=Schistocephalus solidus TaxID=70667 RepID=A0A0X3NXA4_SCHSO